MSPTEWRAGGEGGGTGRVPPRQQTHSSVVLSGVACRVFRICLYCALLKRIGAVRNGRALRDLPRRPPARANARVLLYEISPERSLDIDTEGDLAAAGYSHPVSGVRNAVLVV